VRVKRDRAAASVPEWEALRARASAIKEHALTHLDEYLVQFEENAVRNGMQVHWARDATSTIGSCSRSSSAPAPAGW
jgi:L-lactate dehydrogenase complex protein LldF